MDFLCPVCGAPAPTEFSLCSGSFLDTDHPPNVVPIPAKVEIAIAGPALDGQHPEHEWTALEVVQARSIVKRLLTAAANGHAVPDHELTAFASWLERTNPPASVYVEAVRLGG